MSDIRLSVGATRLIPGCAHGLRERTALVEVAVTGPVPAGAAAEARIRAGVAQLCPEEPLPGVRHEDWPGAFLLSAPPAAVDDEPAGWLARWLIAVTVAIQRWGRDPVWRGRVVRADSRRVVLAIPWRRDGVLSAAADAAAELVSQWVWPGPGAMSTQLRQWFSPHGATMMSLAGYFGEDWQAIQVGGLSPYTLRFIQAGMNRGTPFDVLPSSVQLGWGGNAERFDMTVTGHSGWMACTLARDKWKTNLTLARQGVPVPQAVLVTDFSQAQRAAEEIGWPVVIKPRKRDMGIGVVTGIADAAGLGRAFDRTAQESAGSVILEQHIRGDDYRLLVVRGRVLSSARRSPATITGDGVHSVAQLVGFLNSEPRRGPGKYSLLSTVQIDDEARELLAERGLSTSSVPEPGQRIPLRRIANIARGGLAQNVTAITHPDNIALAERAARIVAIDVAGVDLIIPDISRSWREVGGVVCEVNAQPGLRPHWLAEPARDIEGEILDALFGDRSPRIPTVAIAGGQHAAATAELLQHIWQCTGTPTGVCSSRMLRIGTALFSSEDLSGSVGTRAIMIDPAMHAAVLELRADRLPADGHPCDRYDVVGVLDAAAAAPELELAERVTDAIALNADDPGCLAAVSRIAAARTVLVSCRRGNAAVGAHLVAGGEAVFLDGTGHIVAARGAATWTLLPWSGDPAVLYAAAFAWVLRIDTAAIADAMTRRLL